MRCFPSLQPYPHYGSAQPCCSMKVCTHDEAALLPSLGPQGVPAVLASCRRTGSLR